MNEQRTFTELASYQKVSSAGRRKSGNIIKSGQVAVTGAFKVEVEHKYMDNEPTIFFHRSGEQIEAIEFSCPCGRSATVALVVDDANQTGGQ